MTEAEIGAMWLHVSDTKILNKWFHTMHSQIVHELEIREISVEQVSQCLIHKRPKLSTKASISLSEAFINHHFPPSFVDFEMLDIIIERFSSDCLRSVMKSYCSYMSVFTKQLTAQQLISLHLVHNEPTQDVLKNEYGMIKDFEIPSKFSLMEAKVGQDASKYTLEQIDMVKRRYCSELQLPDIVLCLIAVAEANPFIIRWVVPLDLTLTFITATKVNFFGEYNITSLTIEGVWLYMSEAEIDAMWLHVNNSILNDHFRTIYKQIVHVQKIRKISVNELSQYLMDQQLNLSEEAIHQLSKAFKKYDPFPPPPPFLWTLRCLMLSLNNLVVIA